MLDLIAKIEGAKVIREPFAYFTIPNFFDPVLYNEILQRWPLLSAMTESSSYLVNRNWVYAYGHDPLAEDARIIDFPEGDMSRFWVRLGNQLAGDGIKQAVLAKFGLPPEVSSFHTVRILTDVEGYAIAPHPDGETKVASVLMYCPETDDHPEWGTQIEGAVIPFIRNHMFAFAKTEDSIHWVDRITGPDRNQILLVYER